MIKKVGEICERQQKASEIIDHVQFSFTALRSAHGQRVLYLIWKSPWMCAGKNTFIDAMLTKIGLVNTVTRLRYPELSSNEVAILNPDIIFLSSEPYPFKEHHVALLKEICPRSKVILVDGEMFSWYGSRLRFAIDYFNELLKKF
jgi:ABC-type Fe3+-hydroxamate transport system substrate-binding protein